MDEQLMTKAQEIKQLEQMLRNVKRRKATPGNGFIKMKIAEKLAQLKTEDK